MHATLEDETEVVRIYRDDGTVFETVMTRALRASIARIDAADEKREQRHRAKVKTFTDVSVRPGQLQGSQKTAAMRTRSAWEGPWFSFTLLLGESATWAGPRSQWLTGKQDEAGDTRQPCKPPRAGEPPDEVFTTDADGWVRAVNRKRVRCRFCGHLRRIPPYAVCLNDGCSRSGHDAELKPGRRADLKQAPPLEGGGSGPARQALRAGSCSG